MCLPALLTKYDQSQALGHEILVVWSFQTPEIMTSYLVWVCLVTSSLFCLQTKSNVSQSAKLNNVSNFTRTLLEVERFIRFDGFFGRTGELALQVLLAVTEGDSA